jgi:hypothetical protein
MAKKIIVNFWFLAVSYQFSIYPLFNCVANSLPAKTDRTLSDPIKQVVNWKAGCIAEPLLRLTDTSSTYC